MPINKSHTIITKVDGESGTIYVNVVEGKLNEEEREGWMMMHGCGEKYKLNDEDPVSKMYFREVNPIAARWADQPHDLWNVDGGIRKEAAVGEYKLRPIDIGTHMTYKEFVGHVESGGFINYDGFGELATADEVSNKTINPSDVGIMEIPEWATHVVWYNR